MATSRTKTFPSAPPRTTKRDAGTTALESTPLSIRTTGLRLAPELAADVPKRLSRKLGRFATAIDRIAIRFQDINGPKGGIDRECHVRVLLAGMPVVVVQARAESSQLAFLAVVEPVTRAVKEALAKAGGPRRKPTRKAVAAAKSDAPRPAAKAAAASTADEGSLIGRRVGRGAKNLAAALDRPEKRRRDAYVDTSEPGKSATDRKAGGDSTARRNTLARAPKATATLEDSKTGRPSRKSSRKSANRSRSGTNIEKRVVAKATSPQAAAAKATAKRR